MVAEICVDAVRMALEETKRKCWLKDEEAAIGRLKEGDACAHGYFRFHLVRNIVTCIVASIKGLKAIYIFGSSVNDLASLTSDINILVHVPKKDPKQRKALEDVNASLTIQYIKLLGLRCKPCFKLLDIKVINDAELKAATGTIACVCSVTDRPIVLWKRGKGLCGTEGEA